MGRPQQGRVLGQAHVPTSVEALPSTGISRRGPGQWSGRRRRGPETLGSDQAPGSLRQRRPATPPPTPPPTETQAPQTPRRRLPVWSPRPTAPPTSSSAPTGRPPPSSSAAGPGVPSKGEESRVPAGPPRPARLPRAREGRPVVPLPKVGARIGRRVSAE